MRPSNSTYASVGIGVPVASVISWVVSLFGVSMPGPVEASTGVIVSAVIGYFFLGGKAEDVPPKESP